MSNEDIKNDIAKTMLSAAHELSLYIADANEELRKKVNSQTEAEPGWHDTQTCYELAQDSNRVEAMALRIKELEAALKDCVNDYINFDGEHLTSSIFERAHKLLEQSK